MRRKLAENWKRVQRRVENVCTRVDRDPSTITVVAVTKYASLDVIRVLVDNGVRHLGENRVGELTKRAGMINEWLSRRARDLSAGARPRPNWHMIGHLQRNKVALLLPWVELIHSVDSLRLAEEIDAQSAKLERVTPILMQVNTSGEATKSGIAVAATTHMAEQVCSLKHIELRGLMAMAPLTDDESVVRGTFERARELFDEVVSERLCGPEFRDLSLGMSNDFELGIECGATYLRIGSALFEGVELAPPVGHVE